MNTEELISLYTDRRYLYEKFTDKLKNLLIELIQNQKVECHVIESRTKEIENFREKIIRKNEKYKQLTDITDLSAIRIIVYYPSDISKIVSFLEKEFTIDRENSKISGEDLNPNEFGYLSTHMVILLNSDRSSLAEWKLYKELKSEIQIRTVLQHAWASISHALQYKTKSDIPANLKRKLFRLAGLFELADEQFGEIRTIHGDLIKEIEKDNLEVSERDLNLLSVKNFVKKSKVVKEIYSIAIDCGFRDEKEDPGLDYSPINHQISDLIIICEILKIESIRSLDSLLKNVNSSELNVFFLDQLKTDRNIESNWFVSPSFILELVLIYLFNEKLNSEDLGDLGWESSILERVIKTAKKTFSKVKHGTVPHLSTNGNKG